MDLDYLTTFLEIAKQGGFSRAGRELFRSQSSVSAQIRQLKEEYGQKLFDRIGESMKVTAAGEVLLGYAGRLISSNFARDEVRAGKVKLIAISDVDLWCELGLPYRRDSTFPRAAAAFVSMVRHGFDGDSDHSHVALTPHTAKKHKATK